MANPMAFWKASALPTISGGQARADKAEKCGESVFCRPHPNYMIKNTQ